MGGRAKGSGRNLLQTSNKDKDKNGKGKAKGPKAWGKGQSAEGGTSTAPAGSASSSGAAVATLPRRWKESQGELQVPDPKCNRFERPWQCAAENPDFEGGRARVHPPVQCAVCQGFYATASCILMADDDGNIPVLNSERITKAKETLEAIESGVEVPFKNTLNFDASHSSIKAWCYLC